MYLFQDNKRYNSFVDYYKRIYGERLQKLVIDAGFTCPNRDGTVGTLGCTYCDNAAFHPSYSSPDKPLYEQIEEGIEFHRIRYRNAEHYLAYFQSYSNTYAPLEHLRHLYETALSHPAIVGIVIGTRPDCVDPEKLDYLAGLRDGHILKEWHRELKGRQDGGQQGGGCVLDAPLVTVEYGIESCYDRTLVHINRGHDFECARKAVAETASRGLEVGAHFILGLPGETAAMMKEECDLISSMPLLSVKFHQLQLVKGTAMEKEFADDPDAFLRLSLPDYLDLVIDMLERLRPDLYIERVAGEVPPRFVSQTPWGLIRNAQILHLLEERLQERETFQGRLYREAASR
jgi:radical SAM superfamily enzyme